MLSIYPPDKSILELPYSVFKEICEILDLPSTGSGWEDMVVVIPGNPFSIHEIESFRMAVLSKESPSSRLLTKLGNRGKQVKHLISYLDKIRNEKALLLLRDTEPLEITEHPVSTKTILEGESLILKCSAKSFPYPRFQWFKGQEEVLSGAEGTLCINPVKMSDAGKYCCRLHNTQKNSVQFTRSCLVTVKPNPKLPVQNPDVSSSSVPLIPRPSAREVVYTRDIEYNDPIIIEQPQSKQLQLGQHLHLSCKARGGPHLRYQWFCNGQPVKPGGQEEDDGTSADLVIRAPVPHKHNGQYYCEISSPRAVVKTQTVDVKINLPLFVDGQKVLPEIVKHPPTSACIETGTTIQFVCEAEGKEPLYYQWYKNGIARQGENNSDLKITVNDVSDQGRYQCKVYNDYGECMSQESKLTVKSGKNFVATDKIVLLIGNNEYKQEKPLFAPANDVSDLAELFTLMDYKVVSLLNLTKEEMINAVDFFCDLLYEGVYGVFYFAGHGFEYQGQCYMVPWDVRSGYSTDDCVCAEYVLEKIQKKSPSLAAMILDICRKENQNAIAAVTKTYKPHVRGNTIFFYATSFTMEAFEEEAQPTIRVNGILVKRLKPILKKYLKDSVRVQTVFEQVLKEIGEDKSTSDLQYPELRSNLREDRSFTDKIYYKGHTEQFTANILKWRNAWHMEIGKLVEIPLPKLETTVRIQFEAPFCNVLKATIMTEDSDIATNCVAKLTEFPPEISVRKEESLYIAPPPQGTTLSVLRDIQRLRGPLKVDLEVSYCVAGEEKCQAFRIPLNLGEPLVAPLRLSRTPYQQQEAIEHEEPVYVNEIYNS